MNTPAARHARDLMFRLSGRFQSSVPLGVRPSHGDYGTPQDWDVFTSMCDARAALVLALGGRPDPCTGHTLPGEPKEPVELVVIQSTPARGWDDVRGAA